MKILVVNGPNLNLLGRRNIGHYGKETLEEIEVHIRNKAAKLDIEVDLFQSNHEGNIVDYLQTSAKSISGIVINAGALTHYGLSLRDALSDTNLPIVEIHLSNIHAREDFRHQSIIAPIAVGQISGLGYMGYLHAIEYLATKEPR